MPRNPKDNASHQAFLTRFFGWLSAPGSLENGAIDKMLQETGRHFGFGCGFIYEADHSGTFYLSEHFMNYKFALHVPFRLEDRLNQEEIGQLFKKSFFAQNVGAQSNDPDHNYPQLLEADTFAISPILDAHEKMIGLVGMVDRRCHAHLDEDTTQTLQTVLSLLSNQVKLRIYQRHLDYAQQSMGNILDNLGIDIYVNDYYTHEILYANKSMAAPYGGLDTMLGKKCWEALYAGRTRQCDFCPQFKLIDKDGQPSKIYSWDYQRPFDGSWFRVLSGAFRWVDGRLAHVVSSIDITESKRNEATIVRMANYDALTNLPNRRKLIADCDTIIAQVCRSGKSGYLLFFDLDGFKHLNDKEGHLAGDEYLIMVGKTLQNHPLTAGHGYRYGGDEFVLVYQHVTYQTIESLVMVLLRLFAQPWTYKNASYVCGTSIGISKFPDDGTETDKIISMADSMMYKAKHSGKGMACCSSGKIIRLRQPSSEQMGKTSLP